MVQALNVDFYLRANVLLWGNSCTIKDVLICFALTFLNTSQAQMLTARSLPVFDRLQHSEEEKREIRRMERLLLPTAAHVHRLRHSVPPTHFGPPPLGTHTPRGRAPGRCSACDWRPAGPAVAQCGVLSAYASLC